MREKKLVIFFALILVFLNLLNAAEGDSCTQDSGCGAGDWACIAGQCAAIKFQEDFSTDPNTNPTKWTIDRGPRSTPANSGFLESGYFVLTKTINYQDIGLFADYNMNTKKWRAVYKFKMFLPGCLADGIWFLFYSKNQLSESVNEAWPTSPYYGLELDNEYNSCSSNNWNDPSGPGGNDFGLTKDSFAYHFDDASVNFDNMDKNIWYKVVLEFNNGVATAKVFDGATLIKSISDSNLDGATIWNDNCASNIKPLGPISMDYSQRGIGFFGNTGAENCKQAIDDFKFYALDCVPSCAGKCNGASDGCFGTCTAPCPVGETCINNVCVTTGAPEISFVPPTPANGATRNERFVPINASASLNTPLKTFKYNWNGKNFTIYNNSLILMMNFDNLATLGESSTIIKDASPYGNNGTTISPPNGATWTSSGRYDGAFSFDGVNDYINVPNSESLKTQKELTVSMWLKRENIPPGTGTGLIEKSFGSWYIFMNENGAYSFARWSGGVWKDAPYTITAQIPAGEWHHIAVTYDSAIGVKEYVDGNLVIDDTNLKGNIDLTSTVLYIGSRYGTGPGTDFFKGLIDEVRIWNKSLTSEEINMSYMSNLKKYNSSDWHFFVNQTKSLGIGLDNGIYTYQAFAENTAGILGKTEVRTITIGGFGGRNWTSMNGTYIGSASDSTIIQAGVGSSVLMLWKNTGLAPGTQVRFNIKEDDNLFDDDIISITAIVDSNGNAIAKWTITSQDYGLGYDNDDKEEFYFEVGGGTSDYLIANASFTNFHPTAKIVKPMNGTTCIIPEGQQKTGNIPFEQISSDVDDDLNITWNFGDNTIASNSNCLTGANCNTTHAYNSSGNKIITLTAKEMTRSQRAVNRSNVFVYRKGLNIFAIIDSPDYRDNYLEAGIYWINGTSSHIANCSFSEQECRNTSPNCYKIEDCITPTTLYLWCYKFKESNSPGFAFRWTIAPGNFVNNTNNVPFQKWFYQAGEYDINLKVTATL